MALNVRSSRRWDETTLPRWALGAGRWALGVDQEASSLVLLGSFIRETRGRFSPLKLGNYCFRLGASFLHFLLFSLGLLGDRLLKIPTRINGISVNIG